VDSRIAMLLQMAFVVGALCLFWKLQSRAQARRRRLTTVAARFGLFVSWIATAVALVLGGLGAVGFYNAPTPINQNTWFISGGLCAVALVVWLLGRGVYFVLAGSPPEEPKRAVTTQPSQPYTPPQPLRRSVPTSGHQMGPWERKAPPRP
jgi:hypothetical protein